MLGLEYIVAATEANFDEEQYLWGNPDVELALREGRISSGKKHFSTAGLFEGRKLFKRRELLQRKAQKTSRIVQELVPASIQPVQRDDGTLDFLTPNLRNMASLVETTAISANDYDPIPKDWIDNHPDAWILDAGAGHRTIYYDNVVNFEIVAYPSTDVLGVGESLPFKSDCFDFIISNAVLEHVKDPFTCAKELIRVLKPEGQLFCAVPFLQPFHAYPHHYYNMTHQGLRNLYDDSLEITRLWVPFYFHPMFVISWILNSWSSFLDKSKQEIFLDTRIREFVEMQPGFWEKPFNKIADEAFLFQLGSGTALLGKKKQRSNDDHVSWDDSTR